MRRAQRAAEAGMDTARDLLRRAEQNGAGLVLDGEPLTVERVKAAMAQAFAAHGCDVPTTSSSRPARRGPSATTWAPARSRPASRS